MFRRFVRFVGWLGTDIGDRLRRAEADRDRWRRDYEQASKAAGEWLADYQRAAKERDTLKARVKAMEKNATDLADALERANARAEVAEAARLAAVDEAAVLRQRLVHIRALVGSESRPSVPNR